MARASFGKELYFESDDQTGTLGFITIALKEAGINIIHMSAWAVDNLARFQIVVSDHEKAKKVLSSEIRNVDVRDVGKAHRLCIESPAAGNGSRYILSASDRSGELFTWELQARLKELFPGIQDVGGEVMEGGVPAEKTKDRPRSYCLLAKQELGLEPYSIDETIRATGDSYLMLGLL